MKSPDATMSNDKGALLANSTKASLEDPDSSNEKNNGGTLAISARHLPPVYVDIQEEIESNLEEINRQSKLTYNSDINKDKKL